MRYCKISRAYASKATISVASDPVYRCADEEMYFHKYSVTAVTLTLKLFSNPNVSGEHTPCPAEVKSACGRKVVQLVLDSCESQWLIVSTPAAGNNNNGYPNDRSNECLVLFHPK